MKNLFIATKNPDLSNYLLSLLREMIPQENWNLSSVFSLKLDLMIFDTETVSFDEFYKFKSEIPAILFSYMLKPFLLQFTTKFYISGIFSLEMRREDLIKTLEAVLASTIYYSETMISMLFSNKINKQVKNISALTNRENEILIMMTKDMTNEDIALELDVSIKTINSHKGNIMKKVGVKTTSGLIKMTLDYSAILKTQL
ncbi:MAG: LuxR C-terminal-related transcriptional regulator [Bacteroidota bacterium]